MEKTLILHSKQVTADYALRIEVLEQQQYYVVPVVMMLEGVHHGSGGPLLHKAENLSQNTEKWNGIPVVISHPQNDQGEYISAYDEQALSRHVGIIQNTRFEDGKLKADAYISVQKVAAVSPRALTYIQTQHPMDVSVGVYNLVQEEDGVWNDETYTGIVTEYYPDHLALLPDEVGACSWDDGCGIRVNSNNSNQKNENMLDFDLYKKLNENGEVVIPVNNAVSLNGIMDMVYNYVNSLDNDVRIAFVEEVHDDFFVYRIRNRQSNNSPKLYKQSYSVDDKNELVLNGDPVEVRKNVTYETLQQMQRTKFNNNHNKNAMDTTQKVNQLIANGKFAECDRAWLSTLSEDALAKVEAMVNKPKETAPVLDVNSAIDFLKKNSLKKEEVLSLLSEQDKQAVEIGLATYAQQRTDYIETVTKSSDVWTKEELEAMDFNTLSKLAKSVAKEDASINNYAGLGAGRVEEQDDTDFLPIPSVYSGSKN
jgi:hypothetical protein